MGEELNVRWHRLSNKQQEEALEHVEDSQQLEGLLEAELVIIEKIARWLAENTADSYHLAIAERKLIVRRA